MADHITFRPVGIPDLTSGTRLIIDAGSKANPMSIFSNIGTAIGNFQDSRVKDFDYQQAIAKAQQDLINQQRQLDPEVWLSDPANATKYEQLRSLASQGLEQSNQAREQLRALGLAPHVFTALDDTLKYLEKGNASRKNVAEVNQANASAKASNAHARLYDLQADFTKRANDNAAALDAASQVINSWTPEQLADFVDAYKADDKTKFFEIARQFGPRVNPEDVIKRLTGITAAFPSSNEFEATKTQIEQYQKQVEATRKNTFLPEVGISLEHIYHPEKLVVGSNDEETRKKHDLLQPYVTKYGTEIINEMRQQGIPVEPGLEQYIMWAADRSLTNSKGDWISTQFKPGKEKVDIDTIIDKTDLKTNLALMNSALQNGQNRKLLDYYRPQTGEAERVGIAAASGLSTAIKGHNPIRGKAGESIKNEIDKALQALPSFTAMSESERKRVSQETYNAIRFGGPLPKEISAYPQTQQELINAKNLQLAKDFQEKPLSRTIASELPDGFLTQQISKETGERKKILQQEANNRAKTQLDKAQLSLNNGNPIDAAQLLINSPFLNKNIILDWEKSNTRLDTLNSGQGTGRKYIKPDLLRRLIPQLEYQLNLLADSSSNKMVLQNLLNTLRSLQK